MTSFLEAKPLEESDWFNKSYKTQSRTSYPITQNHKSQHMAHAYNKVYAIIISRNVCTQERSLSTLNGWLTQITTGITLFLQASTVITVLHTINKTGSQHDICMYLTL